jgi:LPXTG-site transpeptidase (sortase) family protein
METNKPKKKWNWRRILSDVIILAGIGVLLYLPATWGWAWWEQRGLSNKLETTHPILQAESSTFFREDMVQVAAEMETLRTLAQKAEEEAAARARVQAFRDAAVDFASAVLDKEGEPIGKIIISKIGLEWVVVQGVTLGDMESGPGHWPETPFPGMGGNFVISGHRNMYGGPFLHLDQLAVGDTIDLLLPYVAARYEVTRSIIVAPTQVEEVAQRGVEEISLTTCDPPFTARNRLVVQAKLVEYKLLSPGSPSG